MATTIRNHPSFLQCVAMAAFTCLALYCPSALAAPINYGDLDDIPPGDVIYTQVTESSGTDPVPLFGAPTVTVNMLDFNPAGFTANAAGGGADITDGQLNFGVVVPQGTFAPPTVAINSISLSEAGDFTLFGIGTAATSVAAGLFMQATITEVDGLAVAPIIVSTSASLSWDLLLNPGVSQGWNLGASVDLEQAIVDAGLVFNLGVTKVDVFLNNTLLAISEPSTAAFIAKKDFVVDVSIVPEPTAAALALMAFLGLGAVIRRNGR